MAYGVNGPVFFDPVNGQNSSYINNYKHLTSTMSGSTTLIRLHGWGMVTAGSPQCWLNSDGTWNTSKIQQALQSLVNNHFTLMINIPSGPDGNGCDINTFPQFCANLVTIVNKNYGYNVKYWELPNERENIYDAATIGRLISACSKAMKNVDSSIKVGGPASSWLNSSALSTILDYAAADIDFTTSHWYGGFGPESDASLYDNAQNLANDISRARQLLSQKSPDKYIPIWIDEWNSTTTGDVRNHDNRGAVIGALVMKSVFANGGDGANWWIDGGWYPWADGNGNLYPSGIMLNILNRYFRGSWVTANSSDTGNINTFAVYGSTGHSFIIINRSGSCQNVDFSFQGWTPGSFTTWISYQISSSGTSSRSASWQSISGGISVPDNSLTFFVGDGGGQTPAPTPVPTATPAATPTGPLGSNLPLQSH